MTVTFKRADIADTITSARAIIDRFAKSYDELLARVGAATADGYPAGGDGPRGSDIANPTEQAALRRMASNDPAADALGYLWQAWQALVKADDLRAAALPPPGEKPRPTTTADVWCTSCQRDHGYCEPRALDRGDLCRWCHDFRGVHAILPPVDLLARRHAGRRIYDRDITLALLAAAASTT